MAFTNAVDATQQGIQYLSSTGTWSGEDGGSAGNVLTSNGTGVAPTFQAASGGGIATITGDVGSISASTSHLYANTGAANCGFSVKFSETIAGEMDLVVTDSNSNTIIGKNTGKIGMSGGSNVIFGSESGTGLTSGQANAFFGYDSGANAVTAQSNVAIGPGAYSSGNSPLASGSFNVLVGTSAGYVLEGAESSNIYINALGFALESNVLRIGESTGTSNQQINSAYIHGISNNDSSGFTNPLPVYIDTSDGQLGFGPIGGGAITTINVDASGSVTGSAIDLFASSGTAAGINGSSVSFVASSATEIDLNLSDALSNTIIGPNAGNATINAINNQGYGATALVSLTTGNYNVAIGNGSLSLLQSGDANCCLGNGSGLGYTSSEAGNICIKSSGLAGESNVIRINDPVYGSLVVACYIGGISGSTVTGTAVLCDTNGQLGTIASSRVYKENIEYLSEETSILDLKPVKFNYISDKTKAPVYGLIAEDVAEVFPDLVTYRDGKIDSVKYHEMPALLIAEIKKLNARIAILEAR